MAGNSKSVLELTENTSPQATDLFYVAKGGPIGSYLDRKITFANFKKYIKTDKTIVKNSDYTIPISQCDKRWYSNQDAVETIIIYLPKSEDGKEIGFMLEENRRIVLQPNASDEITPIGTGSGTPIHCSIKGSAIYLRGYTGGWYVVSEVGTWINGNTSSSSSSLSSSSLSSSSSSYSSASSSSSCSSNLVCEMDTLCLDVGLPEHSFIDVPCTGLSSGRCYYYQDLGGGGYGHKIEIEYSGVWYIMEWNIDHTNFYYTTTPDSSCYPPLTGWVGSGGIPVPISISRHACP